MKEHANILASLAALLLLLTTAVIFFCHGLKDNTIPLVIITGAVGIAQAIAGIKPSQPPPGTQQSTLTITPAAQAEPKEPKDPQV